MSKPTLPYCDTACRFAARAAPRLLCRRRRKGGLTLLELLAALLLVAVVLPVVMRGLSMATQVGSMTRFRGEALALAEARLAEVIATEEWTTGDATGEFDEAWISDPDRYTWELLVDDWSDTSMRHLTMHVRWTQRGREQTVSLATVVAAEAL